MKHEVIDFLTGIIQYDQRNSESGSGKLGNLYLCKFGISLLLPDNLEEHYCLHNECDSGCFTPITIIKTVFLSVDGKQIDLSEYNDFNLIPDQIIIHYKDFQVRVLHLPSRNDPFSKFIKGLQEILYNSYELLIDLVPDSLSQYCIYSFLDSKSYENEMLRLGLNQKKSGWKIIEDRTYDNCNFISPFSVVPSNIRAGNVYKTSSTHSNKRFITWCWTDSETLVSLLRCSEPESNLDNSYLKKIVQTVKQYPRKHSVVSVARLKDSCPGEETISHSFNKLWKSCVIKDHENFLRNIDSCKWLHHMQCFLRVSRNIARTLKFDKNPVVVIDKSGRDISCLIVSLVLLLCDKYFRTVEGFANLINKEWLAAGYPFYSSLMKLKSMETAFLPSFVMFMDCVHNIIIQFPAEFEFTDQYLMAILDKIFYGSPGLFMFDSPREISEQFQDKENLLFNNFWHNILESRHSFVSPLFHIRKKQQHLKPSECNQEEAPRNRAKSYMRAMSNRFGGEKDPKDESRTSKRRSTVMWKAIKKARRKSKRKKESSSNSKFYQSSDESLLKHGKPNVIKDTLTSHSDPLNVNYGIIQLDLWDRYFFRHTKALNYDDSEVLLQKFVEDTITACSDFVSSLSISEESSDQENSSLSSSTKLSLYNHLEPSVEGSLKKSPSNLSIDSNISESRVHVSEIDLFNDHVDKDYESAEELSLNGIDKEVAMITENKDLENVEMSNSKSPHTVELEIEEATNDVADS